MTVCSLMLFFNSRYEANKYDNIFQYTKHISDCPNPSSVGTYNKKLLGTLINVKSSIEYILIERGINVAKMSVTHFLTDFSNSLYF